MDTDIDKAFRLCAEQMNRVGAVAHQRVAAHIQATHQLQSIALFHAAQGISSSDKMALYKTVYNLLITKGGPDWSRLDNQPATQPAAKPAPVKVAPTPSLSDADIESIAERVFRKLASKLKITYED